MFCVAARTRLRKMKADEAAKKNSASTDASKPVERSPHAKEVCLVVLQMPLELVVPLVMFF